MTEQASHQAGGKAGKYLTFRLAGEEYGVAILKVQEIIGVMKVTRVPRTPDFIRGVINLRGKVIPVIDLRRKFELPGQADTERSCIVVIHTQLGGRRATMSVLVDEVCEVANVPDDAIEPAPEFGACVDTNFILGMAKLNQKVVTLLEIDGVLSHEEAAAAGVLHEG